ncbi:hypothetical protein ACERNI_10635 [Camelimonas sp. ID_303_24]
MSVHLQQNLALACSTADFIIKRSLRAVGAPPFVGILELDANGRNKAIVATRAILNGRADNIYNFFRRFPNLATWLVANSLNADYGEDGNAVYKLISNTLGVSLEAQSHRQILHDSFSRVCDRLGLPTRGLDRNVDVYLLHAGVSRAQLPRLIDAFLKQCAAYGPPPTEATSLLNSWEVDALEFLPTAINVLRRAIQWDDTAWHATLFARIMQNPAAFVPANDFESYFKDVLDQRTAASRKSNDKIIKEAVVPRPRLYWSDSELKLMLPRAEGHIRIWLDNCLKPLRLRGGESWTLFQPWPKVIRWEISGQIGQLNFIPQNACVAFDRATGHYLREIRPAAGAIALDSTDVVILARAAFSIGGAPAIEAEPNSFVSFANLGHRPLALELDGASVALSARARRSLSFSGNPIANGPRGPLLGPSAILQVGTGLDRAEIRTLRVALGQKVAFVDVPISEWGIGDIGMSELLAEFAGCGTSDPCRIRVELMSPATDGRALNSAGIGITVWVWPEFTHSDGIVFESAKPIENLIPDECLHVDYDDNGGICLDRLGGYITARAVFDIEGAHVPFDLPWPDVSVTRQRADGSISILPHGSRISVGQDDRLDTIRITCPDEDAQLIIGSRKKENPFINGLTRTFAIRDMLAMTSGGRVLVRRGNGSELLLFELVEALAPQSITFLPARNAVRLRLQFDKAVDAIAVEIEDEGGGIVFAEAALRFRPVSTRRPAWLNARVCDRHAYAVELAISCDWLEGGIKLARLLIRAEGAHDWSPLRKARGESFAVALTNPAMERPVGDLELSRRFDVLCRWLSDCYAEECWTHLEKTIVARWKELGQRLGQTPHGDAVLMRTASVPPPDHAPPGWLPVLHPLQLLPDLYAAPPEAFASLAAAMDTGVTELAALASLKTTRIREMSQLHPTVYLAFRNIHAATSSDMRLEGFDPARFFRNLNHVDADHSAGWFWRGAPLLGPDHWRAAHLRLSERLDAAGLFLDDVDEDGPTSGRQAALQRLMYAAWVSLPEQLRPPVPHCDKEGGEPNQIDLWATALLSGFAQASRFRKVCDYLEALSRRTGVSPAQALSSTALLLRLAPELFAFHLLLWQIAKERP